MTIINRIIKAIKQEVDKPASFVKGEEFENYVRTILFPEGKYALLNRTHNYHTNKADFVASSLKPDFEFQCIDTNRKFHVEVKFRDGTYNQYDKIEWCKPYQLKRYRAINKTQKVFIALGIGERPYKPEEVFIIPLDSINFCDFYDSFLNKYSFPYIDKPVFSSYLWRLT